MTKPTGEKKQIAPSNKTLISVSAAAKLSGIGYPTMKRLVREGVLVVVRLPGRQLPLVDMADVGRMIEAAKTGQTASEVFNEGSASPKQKPHWSEMFKGRFADSPYNPKNSGSDS